MPFKEAKQIFEKETQKPEIKTDQGAVEDAKKVKIYLDEMQKDFDDSIGKMDYRGSQTDKSQYHFALRDGIRKMVDDDKNISENEMKPFRESLLQRSKNLRQRIVEQQKAFEEIQYKEVSDKAMLDVRNGNFKEAKNKFNVLYSSLSDLNKTNKNGNLNEPGLRMDVKIQEQMNTIDNMEKEYNEVFKSGNFVNGLKGENYIHGVDKEGNVILSTYSYETKPGKKSDYMSKEEEDSNMNKFFNKGSSFFYGTDKYENNVEIVNVQYGPKVKLNWMDLKARLRKENLTIQKFQPHKNEYADKTQTQLITDGVDITVDKDKSVAEREANIAVLKQLKTIAHIYSKEFIGSVPEAQRDVLQKAMDEKLNSMGLYFERSKDGLVEPTEFFRKADFQKKAMILRNMVEGVDLTVQRMQMEKRLETEKDPLMRDYLKGEIAFAENRTIDAYALLINFISKANSGNNTDLHRLADSCVPKIKILALQLINLAERHAHASVQESKVKLTEAVREKTLSDVMERLNKMRQLIQEGKALELKKALEMTGLNETVDKRFKGLGIKYTDLTPDDKTLRVYHMTFIEKLTIAAMKSDEKERKDSLMVIANQTKQHKFRGTAALIYKEIMRPEIMKNEKEMQKSPDYWKRVRALYKQKEGVDLTRMVAGGAESFVENHQNDIPISTNAFNKENIKQRQERAKELAIQKAGGKFDWSGLSEKEKSELISEFESDLLDQELQASLDNHAFKRFMDKKGKGNVAGQAYAEMLNYYDERFKFSDESVDAMKAIVAEIAINVSVFAVSGGAGNIARAGVLAGTRALAERYAGNLAVRVGTKALGYGADIVMSELVDRGIRAGLMGQNDPFSLKSFLTHATSVYGVLRLGSHVTAPMISKMAASKGNFGKIAGDVISGLFVEAPLMTGMNVAFGKTEGQSLFAAYGDSLKMVLAGKIGGKLFSSSTGGAVDRAAQNLEFRAGIMSQKFSKNPALAAKGRLLEGMMQKGEMPLENIMQIADSNLTPEQIGKLSEYMKDPNNKAFLLALKYAEENGKVPEEIKAKYEEALKNFKELGLSVKEARKLARSQTLVDLAMEHGPGSREVIEPQLQRAMTEQRKQAAIDYLETNVAKIKEYLSKPRIKKAFEEFVNKWQGNYEKFLEKNPNLAKLLPTELKQIALLSGAIIAAVTGVPVGLGLLQQVHPYEFTEGQVLNLRWGPNDNRTLEIQRIDHSTRMMVVWDSKFQSYKNYSIDGIKAVIQENVMELKSIQDLALRLQKIGMEKDAVLIANPDAKFHDTTGWDISTVEKRESVVKYLEQEHGYLLQSTKIMTENGFQTEANMLLNYKDRSKFIDIESRRKAADDIISQIQRLNGINHPKQNSKKIIDILGDSSITNFLNKLVLKFNKNIQEMKRTFKEGWDALIKKFKGLLSPKEAEKLIEKEIQNIRPDEILLREYRALAEDTQLRPQAEYEGSLDKAIEALKGQDGIVQLRKDIPTILVQDLHAKREALVDILEQRGTDGKTNLEKLQNGELQIVVLGDGMHSEERGAARWEQAARGDSNAMRQEMLESLNVMKIIMDLKSKCPKSFHYLRGNHDDIYGNFTKSEVPQGFLVASWLKQKYGANFVQKWSEFEKQLPLLAVGNNFLASHSEPGNLSHSKKTPYDLYSLQQIANRDPAAVEALTWSRSEDDGGNQADKLLRLAGLDPSKAHYIVGHSVPDGVNLFQWAENRVMRLINPNDNDTNYAVIPADGRFDPDHHIFRAEKPSPIQNTPRTREQKAPEVNPGQKPHRFTGDLNKEDFAEIDFKETNNSIDINLARKNPYHLKIVPDAKNGYLLVNDLGKSIVIPDRQDVHIGRDFNETVFNFPGNISGDHLEIFRNGDKFRITNLGTNGSIINY